MSSTSSHYRLSGEPLPVLAAVLWRKVCTVLVVVLVLTVGLGMSALGLLATQPRPGPPGMAPQHDEDGSC